MLVTASYQVIVTVLAGCQVGGGGGYNNFIVID